MVDQLKDIQSDMNSLYQQNQEAQTQVREQSEKLRETEERKAEAEERKAEAEGVAARLKEEKVRLSMELDTLRPKVGDCNDNNGRLLPLCL